jgi:hypothetical protein
MNKQKTFLDYGPDDSFEEMERQFSDYQVYLNSLKNKLPETVFNFATADWHYNPEDHRCPHDAWLESFNISEVRDIENPRNNRDIQIDMILLGAYHDGRIHLSYKEVIYYNLEKAPLVGIQAEIFGKPAITHGDWLIDEIGLSEENLVVHRIVFSNEAEWIIQCKDFEYKWTPFTETLK